jgi:phthiocerol/phenolphthiocerol synthesis type-I polyketide synthase C
MPARQALDALPGLWNSGEIVVDYASVRWDAARSLLPSLTSPTFAEVVGAGGGDTGRDVRERLAGASPDERKDIILAVLVEEVARILSAAATSLDPHRSVAELGMDSLMAVELRLALEGRLGFNLPMLSLLQQTSLAMIAANLARGFADGVAARPDILAAAQHYETADADDLRPAIAARDSHDETATAR